MAIFVEGTQCKLCGNRMHTRDNLIAFSHFVNNQNDPLFAFSDCVFHEHCLRRHQFGEQALLFYAVFQKQNIPDNRRCRICGVKISDPDDFLGVGLLSSDENNALFGFNFNQFHKSCLSHSNLVSQLIESLKAALKSQTLAGASVQHLVIDLEKLN